MGIKIKMTKTLSWYIKHERAQPLSQERLKGYVRRPGLRFVKYKDIKGLASLFTKSNGVCILWENRSGDIGHYTGLFKRGASYLHFDPTALPIHRLAQITDNPFTLQKELDKHKTTYNKIRYQKIADDIQSCGRHVVCRWNMLQLSDAEYRGVMTHRRLSTDDLAVLLTLPNDLAHWSDVLKDEKE